MQIRPVWALTICAGACGFSWIWGNTAGIDEGRQNSAAHYEYLRLKDAEDRRAQAISDREIWKFARQTAHEDYRYRMAELHLDRRKIRAIEEGCEGLTWDDLSTSVDDDEDQPWLYEPEPLEWDPR